MTVTDDGSEIAFYGEYRELVPNERIVSTEVYEGMPRRPRSTRACLRVTAMTPRDRRRFDDAPVAELDLDLSSGGLA